MPRPGPDALVRLTETIRQLRAIPQVRERAPGLFELLGQTFATFDETDGRLRAELRKSSGSGVDRFPVDDAPDRRKFVDEAKRRATKLVDDAG